MNKKISLIALVMALVLVLCSCGSKEETAEFSYSNGLDENGFWKGVKALDYVTLPDLATIGVNETDIDLEIYSLMNQTAYMKMVENTTGRTVEDGDTLNIDYVGSIDGVEFNGGNTEGMGTDVTIGTTNYIDGFLDQLIGHKAGETFNINVTFPEDYSNEELAGLPAVFKITINTVYDYEAYDLTDNFVQGVLYDDYGVSTVAELRSLVKSSIAYDIVMDEAVFKDNLPSQISEQYEAKLKYEMEAQADYYGMTLDEYVAALYASAEISTYAELESNIQTYVVQVAQEQLMLQAVAEQENIRVTDEDLDELYAETQASYEAAGEEFDKEALIENYGEPYIKQMVLYDKVQEYLATL